ncbi:hypothetical protein P3T35_003043 [Kitasatospora sp. GP30]|uniref:hypothetical protein n=1 Tax=Kitasatospora sp. GP30 TaxID=3035084 RepID=UPI000CAC5720|nr:hypothetical protein [Kitasatospora sp. GP30]MDH6141030.1 hypothetical protein [Kitasatospora sp. GP30]
MTPDTYGITARDLAEQLADTGSWDSADIPERPQSWRAFGKGPDTTTPKEQQ